MLFTFIYSCRLRRRNTLIASCSLFNYPARGHNRLEHSAWAIQCAVALKLLLRTITLAICLFFCSPELSPALADQHTFYDKTVLIIHSYHKDMQWVEEIQQGLEKKLLASLGSSVDIRVEYMDSKRYIEADYLALLTSLWRYKYLHRQPDCLIVCDDNALNFVLTLREDLFRGVPLVFCGVNHYDPARFAAIPNITGVIEAYDLPGTLKIIRQLLPEHRKLFIINDDTTTGKANKKRLEEIHYDFAGHFNFMYSGRLPVNDLQASVETLSADSAILLMSYNRDAEDKVLRYRDAIHAIRGSSSVPIFGVWSFYLGRGIVGGSLVNGTGQGEKAAELCMSILEGTPASALPIIPISPNLPMFDYAELQRFSINTALLPPNSMIINTPDTLWYKHKTAILLSVSLLALQFFIIALLVYNVRRRQISETQLQKNEQNLRITLETIGEAVISVNEYFQVIKANPAASDLFETELESITQRPLVDLLVELDGEGGKQLADLMRRCIDNGDDLELPDTFSFKPGGRPEKRLSGTCSPMKNEHNRIVGAVLICRDITENETIQAMLAQSRKMEAIGQLAGGVAHDFNNLLTGIAGFAELLSLQLKDDKQKSENALKIVYAAGRAKDLTRQLLSFARKGKILSSPVDCHESMRTAIGLLERSIDKGISLQMDLAAEYSIITGDPVQLENIFLNLGINGADAMDNGGILTFRTHNTEISSPITCEFGEILAAGTYLCVSIKDTGCGIEEDMRHTIFEPFYTTKAKGKGTGLGLSAVFGAMKEHGGKIQLSSQPGKGTDFKLYFPVQKNISVTAIDDNTQAPRGKGTILVIDDEELILASAKGLLTELGYTVLVAQGGRKGIETYLHQQSAIDLVLLDMIMPEMDGVGCFIALKEIDPAIKVVICSGYTKTSKVNQIEKLGARGFLQKPYSATEVNKAIHNALKD